ncbi:MAG: hypothetical protein ACRDIF_06410 [Actinomycetota bacterium]
MFETPFYRGALAMVIIRATCPGCGEVDLKAEQIHLLIPGGGEAGTYRFSCPVCGEQVEKSADSRVVSLLISGGVKPERLGEPFPARSHPPISYDDLLDFHLQLQSEHAIEAFLRSAAR